MNASGLAAIAGTGVGIAGAQTIDQNAGVHELWNERGRVQAWQRCSTDGQHCTLPGGATRTEYLGEELGYAGHGVGDVNNDGYDEFAVTHYWRVYNIEEPLYGADCASPGNGHDIPAGDVQVYSYEPSSGQVVPLGDPLVYHDSPPLGRFAHVIRGNADIDGDGRDDVVAGSGVSGGVSIWSYTDRFNPTGVVGERWIQIMRIYDPKPDTNLLPTRRFGWAMTNPADMNGDSVPDLVIGAKGYNSTAPWNREESHKDEGAVFVYCMPEQSWWGRFEPGGADATYAASFFSGAEYNGEPLVSITGEMADDHFSIRITDPLLTRSCLTNNTSCYLPEFQVPSLFAQMSQPEFGNMLRVAKDLDGDGYSDLVVGAPRHDNLHGAHDPMGDNKTYGGKVYVYLSKSAMRSADFTERQFSSAEAMLHEVWLESRGIGSGTTGSPIEIGVLEADIQILSPVPVVGEQRGIMSALEGISQIVPYNVDEDSPGVQSCTQLSDMFVMVAGSHSTRGPNTNYSAFFEIEKRVGDEIDLNGYPTDTIYWDASESAVGTAAGADQLLIPEAGAILGGMGMAGQVDPYTGTCEFWMRLGKTHPGSAFISRTQICSTINGQFGTIWNIFGEPSNTDPAQRPDCSTINNASMNDNDTIMYTDDNGNGVFANYPNLEPYEFWLPEGVPGADQSGVTGSVSKGLSRWWPAGDLNGDGADDLLGTAWFYPSTYLDVTDSTVCEPAVCCDGTTCTIPSTDGVQYFRAGKAFLFDSPFPMCGQIHPSDLDHDGVLDACDNLVSNLDVNGDGLITSADLYLYFEYFSVGNPLADLNNDCVIDQLDTLEWSSGSGN